MIDNNAGTTCLGVARMVCNTLLTQWFLIRKKKKKDHIRKI
jgi:hypothetical protein